MYNLSNPSSPSSVLCPAYSLATEGGSSARLSPSGIGENLQPAATQPVTVQERDARELALSGLLALSKPEHGQAKQWDKDISAFKQQLLEWRSFVGLYEQACRLNLPEKTHSQFYWLCESLQRAEKDAFTRIIDYLENHYSFSRAKVYEQFQDMPVAAYSFQEAFPQSQQSHSDIEYGLWAYNSESVSHITFTGPETEAMLKVGYQLHWLRSFVQTHGGMVHTLADHESLRTEFQAATPWLKKAFQDCKEVVVKIQQAQLGITYEEAESVMYEATYGRSQGVFFELFKDVQAETGIFCTLETERDRMKRVCVKWFLDHKDDPYPTEGEREALAEEIGTTAKKVQTWFNNNRRNYRESGGFSSTPAARRKRAERVKKALEDDSGNVSESTSKRKCQ
ncbi:homeobox domain-containing protein [Sansalvadorimonas verongulae]|uniref:homeobox domain-containing protein n=1 Tax=Sansalvadorimonas verongulae TaxID=2172824 RepID=UPI0012BBFE2A|nr:homeobox domain-containing protein [Sansalvadorimonas verongulae]MTI13828.1 homeobox domain-containing protein [Sansalvadorimonas verongulae]